MAHQTRKIRTCFRLEKGSDFSFSSGTITTAPVDGVKLRYLVIDRKPITRIGECDNNAADGTGLSYYNDPLAYADLILNGDPEEYLKNMAGSHGLED